MSDATEAFLGGQAIPVELADVEAELARLWGPAVDREGGPAVDQPAVTRIALANLVVGNFQPEPARLESVLDTVVGRYPCRAIVLQRGSTSSGSISAEVAALCRLPAPNQPQVCIEQIVLKCDEETLDLLPGAVRPLLEAGLPTALWWAGDPRDVGPVFTELEAESTRVILDLPDPDASPEALRFALDLDRSPFGRDLAWFGITGWRELVAQFFDLPCGGEALRRIFKVQIRCATAAGDRVPRVAAWLAAWLAGQLGWTPGDRRTSGGRIEATFAGPNGPVRVEIQTEAQTEATTARVLAVTLWETWPHGGGSFQLERDGRTDEVQVRVWAPEYCGLPRSVRAPEPDPARRVAGALESSRDDPPYRAALPILLWLLA